MKKFRKSPIAIICYVLAALLFVYFCYMAATTVAQIRDYYGSYGMSAGIGEIIAYVLQNGLSMLVSAITVFMAGYILEAVRKLDPANYVEPSAEVVTVDAPAEAAEDAAEEAVAVEETVEDAAEEAAEVVDAAEETVEAAAEEAAEVVDAAEETVEEAAETVEEAAETVAEAAADTAEKAE
ncbi:MAG: hypothetical protein E7220_05850 [Clostridiales bacterium]|nr:hypothetical protein [Clostridiales bacterium]